MSKNSYIIAIIMFCSIIGSGLLYNYLTSKDYGISKTIQVIDDNYYFDNNIGVNTTTPEHFLTVSGTIWGYRIRQSKIYHAYGGYEGATTTIALSKDTWAKITNASNTLWGGLEADGITLLNDSIKIANAGDYSGIVSFSVASGQSNDFDVRIYNSSTASQAGYMQPFSTYGIGNFMSVTLPFYLEASAGDEFDLQVVNITDNDDIDLRGANFYMIYIHD